MARTLSRSAIAPAQMTEPTTVPVATVDDLRGRMRRKSQLKGRQIDDSALDEVRSQIEELQGLRRGSIKLVASQALAPQFMPQLVADFRRLCGEDSRQRDAAAGSGLGGKQRCQHAQGVGEDVCGVRDNAGAVHGNTALGADKTRPPFLADAFARVTAGVHDHPV